ncbi:50S ribosomal protein L25 [Patescibacteria group bacterium]
MEKITLKADKRDAAKSDAKKQRRDGYVPAVLYGREVDNIPLRVEYRDFDKVYETAGGSAIVTVKFDKEERNVLIQNVQRDVVTGNYTHIDFFQIRMDEKITTEISVILDGAAPAVKEQGGILIKNLDKIEIECLPAALIRDISIDISSLKALNDSVHVKDLNIPEGIEVNTSVDEVIAFIEEPRSEEELEQLDEEITEDVEAVEGMKEEEEEGEEGEEGAEGEDAPEEKEKEKEAAPTEEAPKE